MDMNPEIRRSIFREPKIRLALAFGGAGLALMAACGAPAQRGIDITSTPAPIETPTNLTPESFLPNVPKGSDLPPNPPKETPTPEATKTPEVKTLQCDILSPEACATGEYIEWNRPDGAKLKGFGFVLKPGEEVKLPKEGLAVSTRIIQQPSVYRGVQVIATTKDSSEEYAYYANLDPTKLKLSELPPNTVGIIADSNLTVFEGHPYNLVFGSFPVMKKFAPITKNPPKVINNKVPGEPAANTAFFYGVTPPK